MNLKAKFTEHPASVGETYGEHFFAAMSFSTALLRAAFACAVHAVLPFAFEKTASDSVTALYDRMVTNRSRLACEKPATEKLAEIPGGDRLDPLDSKA